MALFFHPLLMLLVLVILTITSLFVGVTSISIFDIFNFSALQNDVFIISRIPRTISIIITGASLSICGLIMQQITQNKFVSPTTAGTMDCARFGILVCFIFFANASFLTQVSIASAFALFGSLIFIQILNSIHFKDPIFVPLVGLMFGGVIGALTTFFAYGLNLIQNMQGWLQGNFSNLLQGSYEIIYITLPLLVIAYLMANKLTIVGMGEEIATNLGLSYKFLLNVALIIVSIITSVIILTVGIIPFLGLIIPNIVSLYRGDNLKSSIFYIALLGAIFLLACDIFARLVIYPFEVPISLVVGAIGSFVFIMLLIRRKHYA